MRVSIQSAQILDPESEPGSARALDLEAEFGRRTEPREVTLDRAEYLVVPLLVDVHVHLREPGQEYKETIETGCRAARAGGFDVVACMPNTNPAIDRPDIVTWILERAEAVGRGVRVLPMAAATVGNRGRELSDLEAVVKAGCAAISDDAFPIADPELMRDALQASAELGVPFVAHCEDKEISAGGVINSGPAALRLAVPGIKKASEYRSVERNIELADDTRAHLHVAHVSTRESVDLIGEAKKSNIRVTAEVCPHHLALTDADVERLGTLGKMNPPLRTREDVQALVVGLADGTLDVIATDHAPHTQAEKDESLSAAPFGVIGLETALAVSLTLLCNGGGMDEAEVIRRLSRRPAEILGIEPPKLNLDGGSYCLIERRTQRIGEDWLRSKSSNSPFIGYEVEYRPVMTVIDGVVGFDHFAD